MFGTFLYILKNDGILGLYRGVRISNSAFPSYSKEAQRSQELSADNMVSSSQLSASILRQLTYSTTRFGIYSELKDRLYESNPSPSMSTLILIGSTSGVLGGIAGNPADVLNVRMQHDASLPLSKRRNYKNAFEGLYRLFLVEPGGWRNGFKGVGANSIRAGLMTASQLASYDGFKRGLVKSWGWDGESLSTHFSASLLAGLVATTVCSPVDVVKTRIMSAASGQSGTSSSGEGAVALLSRTFRDEGWVWMFRGWVPSFVRLGPHTIATFLFLEQHKKLWRQWKGISDDEVD